MSDPSCANGFTPCSDVNYLGMCSVRRFCDAVVCGQNASAARVRTSGAAEYRMHEVVCCECPLPPWWPPVALFECACIALTAQWHVAVCTHATCTHDPGYRGHLQLSRIDTFSSWFAIAAAQVEAKLDALTTRNPCTTTATALSMLCTPVGSP